MIYREEHVRQLQAQTSPSADELFCLGEIHAQGLGNVEQNYTKACQFFQQAVAADPSNGKALYHFAQCCDHGYGTAKKKSQQAQAPRLYAQSLLLLQQQTEAFPNDAHAQYLLGRCYCFGDGVAKDNAKAVVWSEKAAKQGHAMAQTRLGDFFSYGWRGVTKDKVEGVCWYAQAARQGSSDATARLGWLFQDSACLLNELTNRATKNCSDYLAVSALAYIYDMGVFYHEGSDEDTFDAADDGAEVVAANAELAWKWKQHAKQCSEPIPFEWLPLCLQLLCAPVRVATSATPNPPFYQKLVEQHDDSIVLKLRDLVPLLADVHQMKIYYTFVSQQFRTSFINLEDRNRYIVLALEKTVTIVADNHSRVLFGFVVDQCRAENMIDDYRAELFKGQAMEFHMTNVPVHVDVRQALSALRFAIGEVGKRVILVEGRVQNMETQMQYLAQHVGHLEQRMGHVEQRVGHVEENAKYMATHVAQVTECVDSMATSIKQLHKAFRSYRRTDAAIGAICSVLNAFSMGVVGNLVQGVTTAALAQIVDFGDVAQIAAVVQRMGRPALTRAVEDAVTMCEQVTVHQALDAGLYGAEVGAEARFTKQVDTILGKLSTAVQQKAHAKDKEEAAIMALVVTAKLTQAVEANTTTSSAASMNDSSQMDTTQAATAVASDRDSASPATPSRSLPGRVAKLEQVYGSNLNARVVWLETSMGLTHGSDAVPDRLERLEQAAKSPPPDGLSLPARVQRLEEVYGSNLAERVTWLESVIGTSGESMSLPERLDRLESQ